MKPTKEQMLARIYEVIADKTLSFWCLLTWWLIFDTKQSVMTEYDEKFDNWPEILPEEIIWHPLTWWRIQLLMVNMEPSLEKRIKSNGLDIEELDLVWWLYKIFKENLLYDQNELQRMEHEKRPELKKLLMQFADYL